MKVQLSGRLKAKLDRQVSTNLYHWTEEKKSVTVIRIDQFTTQWGIKADERKEGSDMRKEGYNRRSNKKTDNKEGKEKKAGGLRSLHWCCYLSSITSKRRRRGGGGGGGGQEDREEEEEEEDEVEEEEEEE